MTVRLNDERFPVTFYDPVRMTQNLEDIVADNRGVHLTDPGLVIVSEVTTANIRRAVADLVQDGFFQSLRPLV